MTGMREWLQFAMNGASNPAYDLGEEEADVEDGAIGGDSGLREA